MKNLLTSKSKSAQATLALCLVSAITGSAAVLDVPAVYSTVQAAVDAANNGDTVRIAAGVYTNQVVVAQKNLTLSGSPGTVLRATPGMQSTLEPYIGAIPIAAVLGIFDADVVVSGLTFEGERLGDFLTNELDGICFFAAGGRVDDCRITGFRGDTLGNDYNDSGWGYGVHVVNDPSAGGVIHVEVVRNTFADNAVSINLIGDGGPTADTALLRTTFTVEGNTIVGNGPDADGRQFGIWIWAGGGGEVKQNTITDHAYTGTNETTPFSFGIVSSDIIDRARGTTLVALQRLHLEGNILRNNQIDLLLERADGSSIVNNLLEGAAPGYRPGGLNFSGEGVVVATNRFSDLESGILLFGDDPDFGMSLGIASNAVLIANGFCNVATNLTVESLATYTEQGTLECPWPKLDIRAVQLSWPYSYNGYSVEIAPGPSGPWKTSEATVFQQGRQNAVVIPTDSGQQFFRLQHP